MASDTKWLKTNFLLGCAITGSEPKVYTKKNTEYFKSYQGLKGHALWYKHKLLVFIVSSDAFTLNKRKNYTWHQALVKYVNERDKYENLF